MRKNILIALFLFILANGIFAAETNTISTNNENGINSHRHSIGMNFGPTIFYMLVAPSVMNLALPSNDPNNLKLQGNFGLDITYTYRLTEKMEINADAGFYAMKTYYDNAKAKYNGNVYGIGFSAGMRFYFNNKNRASGFFLMPKIGTTLFITHGKEYQKAESSYTNKNTNIWDFYVSGEMGFRIDISRGLGINSGIRPFLDVSILEIGMSYKSILRFVPLPRLAIGILF